MIDLLGWICESCGYKKKLTSFEKENINLIKSERKCPKCGGTMIPYSKEEI